MKRKKERSGFQKLELIGQGIYRLQDTCNVYILKDGAHAVIIDFGSGDILNYLGEIEVSKIDAVLMTHHHRDQGQGLEKAVDAGIPIYVPHMEQDLFTQLERFWQGRQILNNYNVRQDRFSLRVSTPIAGTLRDYQDISFHKTNFTVLPTPGHTPGSISLMTKRNDQRIIFSGDLIFGEGKLWSLSATQWTYNGAEGIPATIASLMDLKDRKPDKLLPSHGKPIHNPSEAMEQLIQRLWRLLRSRGENLRLFELRDQPYVNISPHLLQNRTSMANSYVLLSESGKALFIDFGYDFITGIPYGTDRAARRPWLYTLDALKEQYGVSHIDVALPTHYHDDHVAGFNLLREVEGTQTWVPENFNFILENPIDYDLPCLWYDPIPVDRILPLERPIQWEEYTLELYPLPGHTHYAVAILLDVDEMRVLAVGDQYQGDKGLNWNYVYQNRYQIGDYQRTAELYKQLQPNLILPGHWKPFYVDPGYYERLLKRAQDMEGIQRDILPDKPDMGPEGFIARITPYQAIVCSDEKLSLFVEVKNPYKEERKAKLSLITPQGWHVGPAIKTFTLSDTTTISFELIPQEKSNRRRVRIAVDVTIGDHRFGEQAEALITVTPRNSEK